MGWGGLQLSIGMGANLDIDATDNIAAMLVSLPIWVEYMELCGEKPYKAT